MSGIYANIDSVGRKITQVPVIIDGVERNTKTGYACVDGVGREFFGGSSVSGTPLNDYAVGTIVYVNVNGVRTQFVVAHKGSPSTSIYSSSCDGIWLLMKDIYEKRQWHSSAINSDTSYSESTIHSYLNSTFLNSLDSSIKNIIKTVKIPYVGFRTTDGVTGETLPTPVAESRQRENGLSTRIFLLSGDEIGGYAGHSYLGYEGSRLDYFSNNASRIGYYNGTATFWWTRSPAIDGAYGAHVIINDGTSGWTYATISYGIRPAFILPSDIQVDSNLNIIA